MYRFIIIFYLFSFSLLSIGKSQEIPNEFFKFQSQKLLYDSGDDWQTITTFGPVRFNPDLYSINDSLNVQTRFGLTSLNEDVALYGFGLFSFKSYFYGYLYPRVVNDPDAFPRYTGQPRDPSQDGFNSRTGETDLAGIGFQNDWLLFQLGRGRQSWGAGNDIQLALSENSPSYDYGMLNLNFGKLRVRYFHGFLESDSLSYNRYVTGRCIEWSNQASLMIALSEIVIYSGENRPFDIAYLNPISTHLEIELNDRQNKLGTSSGNAAWQASVDWLILSTLRMSGNLLFDEFVLDQVEKDAGKGHGMAYSAKVAYTPVKSSSALLTTYFSLITVGTHTFRHGSGYNNFIQRNKPLGWENGSDGRKINLGLNYFNMKNLIGNMEIGIREIGEESVTSNPYGSYSSYLTGPFPSGDVNKRIYASGKLQWWWKPNISLFAGLKWQDSNMNDDQAIKCNLGVDVYFPKDFNI